MCGGAGRAYVGLDLIRLQSEAYNITLEVITDRFPSLSSRLTNAPDFLVGLKSNGCAHEAIDTCLEPQDVGHQRASESMYVLERRLRATGAKENAMKSHWNGHILSSTQKPGRDDEPCSVSQGSLG